MKKAVKEIQKSLEKWKEKSCARRASRAGTWEVRRQSGHGSKQAAGLHLPRTALRGDVDRPLSDNKTTNRAPHLSNTLSWWTKVKTADHQNALWSAETESCPSLP